MSNSAGDVTLDLRDMVPRARHEKIFSTFESLGVGSVLSIINDHDPKPLYYQFAAEYEGEFEWVYRERGPVDWKVDIARVKERKPATIRERVEKALAEVRPHLWADGGDVMLVGVTDDHVVEVSLVGACNGCPSAQMTFQMGVERIIKEKVPEVTRVEMI
ncbi:MAG: DUF2249 domain-containing protein [Candidatus Latescibacterota bacterium]